MGQEIQALAGEFAFEVSTGVSSKSTGNVTVASKFRIEDPDSLGSKYESGSRGDGAHAVADEATRRF